MAETLRVIANLTSKSGKEMDALEVMKGLVEPTRAEPGCLQYDLYLNAENKAHCALIEEWKDQPTYYSHFNTDHIKSALKRAEELLADHVDIKKLQLIGTAGPGRDMPQDALAVLAVLTAKRGQEAELRGVLEGLVESSRAEGGCLRYDLHVNMDNPREFVFVENWKSGADLDAHFETPHFQEGRDKMAPLLVAEPDLFKLTRIA